MVNSQIHQIIGQVGSKRFGRCGATEGDFSGWNSRVTCEQCLTGEAVFTEYAAADKEANKKRRKK